jgi:hypothetical protein
MIPRKKNQRPDFLYRRGDGILGVEHTTVRIRNLQELKGIQRQIVNQAKELAEAEGIPPLEVLVHFHDYYSRYPLRGKQQSASLFSVIKKNLQRIKSSSTGVKIKPPQPFCGIDGIYATNGNINGIQWLENHRWSIDEVGFVQIGFEAELRAEISKKNRKIAEYMQRCNSCWLLLVADRSKSDQKFVITDEMQNCLYYSLFERTFFMEPTEGLLVELKG